MTQRLFLANDYNSSIAWGGFHITIIGKGNKMSFDNIVKTSLYAGKKNWTFSSKPVAILEQWKGVWTIVFKSQTIDILANELLKLGFSSVKGPISGTSWHISLNGVDKKKALELFNYFVTSPKRPHWYFTLCTEDSNHNFTWQRIN
jgi:hypothetical protein